MTFPSFNVGDVLTAADMNAVGLWKVSTATIAVTNGTATTGGVITANLFNTSYDRFRIQFYDVVATSGTPAVFGQLSVGSTASTTGYYSSGQYVLWASNTGANASVNNGSAWVFQASNNTVTSSSWFDLYNVSNAAQTQILGQKQNYDAMENLAGYHSATTIYDGLRLYSNGATVNLKVAVYGYRD